MAKAKTVSEVAPKTNKEIPTEVKPGTGVKGKTPFMNKKTLIIITVVVGLVLVCCCCTTVVAYTQGSKLSEQFKELTNKKDTEDNDDDDNKTSTNDEDTDDADNDNNSGYVFEKTKKDPRIVMINEQNGWTIFDEEGNIESVVETPDFVTDDDGYYLSLIQAIYWLPNNSDLLVVRDGSYDEEFDYYLTAVSEDGEQSKDIYETNDNFDFSALYISDNGDITMVKESYVEDSDSWTGSSWGGKIVVIGIDGTVKEEYDHTSRLFSGNGAFCWDPDNSDMGITIASYPIENNPAWYDSLVYADPLISDEDGEILIDSYVDYGEPNSLDCTYDLSAVAMAASDASGSPNLFFYDVDADNLLQITHYVIRTDTYTGSMPGAFALSPDGTKIIYSEHLEDFSENIVLINSDGTESTVLFSDTSTTSFDW